MIIIGITLIIVLPFYRIIKLPNLLMAVRGIAMGVMFKIKVLCMIYFQKKIFILQNVLEEIGHQTIKMI